MGYSTTQITMYCVKCKAKKEDPNAEPFIMKNGKSAKRGVCPDCGTKMCVITKAA